MEWQWVAVHWPWIGVYMACKDFALSLEKLWCPSKYLSFLTFLGFNKKTDENPKKNNKNMKSLDTSNIHGRGWAMDGRVLAMDWRGLACKEFAVCV